MLLRVATYTNDSEHLSAGAALAQLQMVLSKSVLYLDQGWQTLVDGLRKAAEDSGVKIMTESSVQQIDLRTAVRRSDLANGSYLADNLILAIGPNEASRLLGIQLRPQVPVKMAALTVGLKKLPAPRLLAAFGMDSPFYLSVHSAWAQLTTVEGTALIHAGKYLLPGKKTDAKSDQLELEQFLDQCQPGWREEVAVSRYLPQLTVSNALVTAAGNGFAGRPNVEVEGEPGVYLCGDWVGNRGMLCDASFASAKKAAQLILNKQNKSRQVA